MASNSADPNVGSNSLYVQGLRPLNEDDWQYKSAQEKRRWAFDKLALYRDLITTYEDRPSTEELFAKADLLIAYINGSSPSRAPGADAPAVPRSGDVPSSSQCEKAA